MDAKLVRIARIDQALLPQTYSSLSSREELLLDYVGNFETTFLTMNPSRKPIFLAPMNECGVHKFLPTTLRPAILADPSLTSARALASFVASSVNYEPLAKPHLPPAHVVSPQTTLEWQRGDAFDVSVLLASLLIGAGYNAYVCIGYADARLTNCQTSAFSAPAGDAFESYAQALLGTLASEAAFSSRPPGLFKVDPMYCRDPDDATVDPQDFSPQEALLRRLQPCNNANGKELQNLFLRNNIHEDVPEKTALGIDVRDAALNKNPWGVQGNFSLLETDQTLCDKTVAGMGYALSGDANLLSDGLAANGASLLVCPPVAGIRGRDYDPGRHDAEYAKAENTLLGGLFTNKYLRTKNVLPPSSFDEARRYRAKLAGVGADAKEIEALAIARIRERGILDSVLVAGRRGVELRQDEDARRADTEARRRARIAELVADKLAGQRVHCWVYVAPTEDLAQGGNSAGQSTRQPAETDINEVLASMDTPAQVRAGFFVDPGTGAVYTMDCPMFHGLEAVFNHRNYFVSLQTGVCHANRRTLDELVWDFLSIDHWCICLMTQELIDVRRRQLGYANPDALPDTVAGGVGGGSRRFLARLGRARGVDAVLDGGVSLPDAVRARQAQLQRAGEDARHQGDVLERGCDIAGWARRSADEEQRDHEARARGAYAAYGIGREAEKYLRRWDSVVPVRVLLSALPAPWSVATALSEARLLWPYPARPRAACEQLAVAAAADAGAASAPGAPGATSAASVTGEGLVSEKAWLYADCFVRLTPECNLRSGAVATIVTRPRPVEVVYSDEDGDVLFHDVHAWRLLRIQVFRRRHDRLACRVVQYEVDHQDVLVDHAALGYDEFTCRNDGGELITKLDLYHSRFLDGVDYPAWCFVGADNDEHSAEDGVYAGLPGSVETTLACFIRRPPRDPLPMEIATGERLDAPLDAPSDAPQSAPPDASQGASQSPPQSPPQDGGYGGLPVGTPEAPVRLSLAATLTVYRQMFEPGRPDGLKGHAVEVAGPVRARRCTFYPTRPDSLGFCMHLFGVGVELRYFDLLRTDGTKRRLMTYARDSLASTVIQFPLFELGADGAFEAPEVFACKTAEAFAPLSIEKFARQRRRRLILGKARILEADAKAVMQLTRQAAAAAGTGTDADADAEDGSYAGERASPGSPAGDAAAPAEGAGPDASPGDGASDRGGREAGGADAAQTAAGDPLALSALDNEDAIVSLDLFGDFERTMSRVAYRGYLAQRMLFGGDVGSVYSGQYDVSAGPMSLLRRHEPLLDMAGHLAPEVIQLLEQQADAGTVGRASRPGDADDDEPDADLPAGRDGPDAALPRGDAAGASGPGFWLQPGGADGRAARAGMKLSLKNLSTLQAAGAPGAPGASAATATATAATAAPARQAADDAPESTQTLLRDVSSLVHLRSNLAMPNGVATNNPNFQLDALVVNEVSKLAITPYASFLPRVFLDNPHAFQYTAFLQLLRSRDYPLLPTFDVGEQGLDAAAGCMKRPRAYAFVEYDILNNHIEVYQSVCPPSYLTERRLFDKTSGECAISLASVHAAEAHCIEAMRNEAMVDTLVVAGEAYPLANREFGVGTGADNTDVARKTALSIARVSEEFAQISSREKSVISDVKDEYTALSETFRAVEAHAETKLPLGAALPGASAGGGASAGLAIGAPAGVGVGIGGGVGASAASLPKGLRFSTRDITLARMALQHHGTMDRYAFDQVAKADDAGAVASQDYLYTYLPDEFKEYASDPALMAKPLPQNIAMVVRGAALDALRGRLVERASIIASRLEGESEHLKRRRALYNKNAEQLSASDREQILREIREAVFRIDILEMRSRKHEEDSLRRFAELEAKLRADPRLAGLGLG